MKNFFCLLILFQISNLFAQDFNILTPNIEINDFVVADFDGDGDLDAFGVDYGFFGGLADAYLFRGEDTSPISFIQDTVKIAFDIKGQPAGADYDGDGDMDVIVSVGSNHSIYLLENDGSGNFTEVLLSDMSNLKALEAHDLENDGDIDVFGFNYEEDVVDILVNEGNNTFRTINLVADMGDVSDMKAGDMDGDGDTDVIVAIDEFRGQQLIYFSKNFFESFLTVVLEEDAFSASTIIDIADVNADAKPDIVAVAGTKMYAWISEGNNKFNKNEIFAESSFGNRFDLIQAVDITGNGIPEIVAGNNEGGVKWYQQTSLADLTYEQKGISTLKNVTSFAQGDFDSDGDIDIFATNNGGFWHVYENVVPQLPPVSTNNILIENIQVFPNPSTEEVNFQNIDLLNKQAEIYNSIGLLIDQVGIIGGKINIAHLAEGIYFLRVRDEANKRMFTSVVTKL